ncbi:MAG: dialkylresorcinol condensing enzyme DarA [Capnocytophaga sp.]|nr:dialkylresorcinol condensing enzyme DarA [Capnocytophaga sp.]
MKNILVIYYSQSGQLKEIVDNVLKPFENEEVTTDFLPLRMKKEFPFPWDKESFFGVFPESFLQIPQEIEPIEQDFLNKSYDLVILAYQVWYLSPSIPINSFLMSEEGKKILSGKPVITISGSRNMWAKAQEKVKELLIKSNAFLVGNIALSDAHQNHISVITIVHWMFSGKKEKYLGIFPLPGVAQKEIEGAKKYGEIIIPYLKSGSYEGLQTKIIKNGGVRIPSFLISADKKANRLFRIWATKIYNHPKRKFLLKCFHIYLYFAIWVMMPIVLLFYWLTYPFFYYKIQKEIQKVKNI